jgi:hypothetical protein
MVTYCYKDLSRTLLVSEKYKFRTSNFGTFREFVGSHGGAGVLRSGVVARESIEITQIY